MNLNLPLHTVFLSLGSNLGDKNAYLQTAIREIKTRIGTVSAVSSIYETDPWGFQSAHSFLNMAIRVETRLLPRLVLYITQAIEREMGREKKSQGSYQDRIIDIDLILYDQLTIDIPELTLPHPRYREREFVRKPLEEIIGND
ncbi:MAG: 2-amino-4-hydroxy-6-hydroxymethyldihydropteridine diphosphokinase [Dysgonamonadaceae bacterium]|jgi:2-amino-4-hydroxy-6-hydroxymethyldihydropteridine diphosphokinase|nr:2-amino-4-hydroxy-6-hydroxymethyldihydropteridine diphosphokinase [Dysgonamonadaceae bacterium]